MFKFVPLFSSSSSSIASFVDPDSEIVVFAKRTVKDMKLPPVFVTHIASSIQAKPTDQLHPLASLYFSLMLLCFQHLRFMWFSFIGFARISLSLLTFGHLKGKICMLARRLSLLRYVPLNLIFFSYLCWMLGL